MTFLKTFKPRSGSWRVYVRMALLAVMLFVVTPALLKAQTAPAPTAPPAPAAAPAPAPAPAAPPAPARAATPAPPAPVTPTMSPAPASPGAGILNATLPELFMTAPIINTMILACSLISVTLFVYFFFTMTTSVLVPTTFVDDVNKLVVNQKYEEAAALCRTHHRVFIASIIRRCVDNAGKSHAVMLDILNTEGARAADQVWNRLSYLADIANITPMLGLLGTVIGMIEAFYGMRSQALTVESTAFTSAMGGALSATMFGLFVAIMSTVFYSIIKGRMTRSLGVAEQVVHSVADHIKRGGL